MAYFVLIPLLQCVLIRFCSKPFPNPQRFLLVFCETDRTPSMGCLYYRPLYATRLFRIVVSVYHCLAKTNNLGRLLDYKRQVDSYVCLRKICRDGSPNSTASNSTMISQTVSMIDNVK